MTDFASLLQPDRGGPAHADPSRRQGQLRRLGEAPERRAPRLARSAAVRRQDRLPFAILPAAQGHEFEVVSTVANVGELSPWCLAKLGEALPEGTYRLAEGEPGPAALGWLLGQHRFTATSPSQGRRARPARPADQGSGADRPDACASPKRPRWSATSSTRPPPTWARPSWKRPPATLPRQFGAKVEVTAGDALAQGYPMIAAVGRARRAERAPRLIELHWGNDERTRGSRSSARASASTPAGSTSSRPAACG